MKRTKNLTYAALFIVIGLILPILFHNFGMGGKIFLPMHLPVFIAGLVLQPFYALAVGVITPILSSVLTGMPPTMPMLPIMVFELASYGLVTSLLRKRTKLPILACLLIAMLVGRISAGLVVFILQKAFLVEIAGPFTFIKTAIIVGLPGIIIQLLFVPIIGKLLEKQMNKI